MLKCFFFSS